MAINFPESPVLNQVFSSAGRRWRWDGTTWLSLFDKGNVDISDTPPLNPSLGDLWYDSSTGICFVYYYDGDSYQWADIGSGGNITLNPLSAINSPTINLSYNSTTQTLSADVSSISSFFTGTGTQLLSSNGYQKLPGGLILQWGSFNTGVIGNETTGTVTYPIAFPTSGLQVIIGSCTGIISSSSASTEGLTVSTISTTNFGWTSRWDQRSASTPDPIRYIAIGY